MSKKDLKMICSQGLQTDSSFEEILKRLYRKDGFIFHTERCHQYFHIALGMKKSEYLLKANEIALKLASEWAVSDQYDWAAYARSILRGNIKFRPSSHKSDFIIEKDGKLFHLDGRSSYFHSAPAAAFADKVKAKMAASVGVETLVEEYENHVTLA